MVLPNNIDMLHPPSELKARKHKLKRLVPTPNSFFMDVKCQGCLLITTIFSHSQTVVVCANCQTVLCQSTGGKARFIEGCSFRKKEQNYYFLPTEDEAPEVSGSFREPFI
ncbi:Small ribosomal subunit protein eS27w [Orobanche minor]